MLFLLLKRKNQRCMIFLTSPWNMSAPYGHDQCSVYLQQHCGQGEPCGPAVVLPQRRYGIIDARQFPYQSQISRFPLQGIQQFAVPLPPPPPLAQACMPIRPQ
jgi:hypothetical protein